MSTKAKGRGETPRPRKPLIIRHSTEGQDPNYKPPKLKLGNFTKLIATLTRGRCKAIPQGFRLDFDMTVVGRNIYMIDQVGWQDKPPCGAAGCIAGHCNIIESVEVGHDFKSRLYFSDTEAQAWLGLTHAEAQVLFFPPDTFIARREAGITQSMDPWDRYNNPYKTTSIQAARVVARFRDILKTRRII